MEKPLKYSFVIPVFNRPDEVDELLDSLTRQSLSTFEVVVVEDGSQVPCHDVCARYVGKLDLHYFSKPNSGPGQSRNYGVERARGEYVIILDSDVVVPPGYLQAVDDELKRESCEAFGGPDRAADSFTPTQKAISYSMTSFFTTGGIRGGKKKLDKFYPRSFNMGIRRDVYQRLGGFSKMRFGEDIDFSIRIFKAGLHCRLFPGAWVYHKRRTDFRKFWRQVFNSGIVFLALLFVAGLLSVLFSLARSERDMGLYMMTFALVPLILYSLLILADSARQSHSLKIGLLSVRAAFTQLMGYGCGFLQAWWRRCVRGQDEFAAYEKNFYK